MVEGALDRARESIQERTQNFSCMRYTPMTAYIKAKFFVIGYALIELYMGTMGTPDGVAHFAHLGGMLFGLILILLWRKKGEIGGPYV